MASFSSQPICQELDKHGAWQQLGTKGVYFSNQKVGFDIFEGEKHFEDVTLGGKGDPLPCPSRHAFKIFWGYWRRIQVWGCGKWEFKILYKLSWNNHVGVTFFKVWKYLSSWERLIASICRSSGALSIGLRNYCLNINDSALLKFLKQFAARRSESTKRTCFFL